MLEFETRVGSYGVTVADGRILLTHESALDAWTLPGGGLELGETSENAAVREIREETGYDVVIDGLLGVHSGQVPPRDRLDGGDRHLHLLRVLFRTRIVGGELTREADGSTDDARWFHLSDVTDLERVDLVDVGLRLWNPRSTDLREPSDAKLAYPPDPDCRS